MKTIPVFLPADGEASWLLLPSWVSLLSGSTMQPKKHLLLSGDTSSHRVFQIVVRGGGRIRNFTGGIFYRVKGT